MNSLISAKYHSELMNQSFECDIYATLESNIQSCGPLGYLLGYGQRYCHLFSLNALNFSLKGQNWVRLTRFCLANKISQISLIDSNSYNTCKEIQEYGIQSHASCYVSSGFCELPLHDFIQIIQIVGWKHLLDTDGIGQQIKTIHGCLDKLVSAIRRSPNS